MSYTASNLIDKKLYLSTAENVMVANLSDMLHDIRKKGVYEIETTSVIARAAAISQQNAVFSTGRFKKHSAEEV